MEYFILRIVALICVSVVNLTIIISRKDDLGVLPILIAVILEFLSLVIIFSPEILQAVKDIIALF